jgi:glyoxylase-like metal-dependent hydrolase (beta-lactamase superfamily II)/rhodanese-related sulfurtransferase
MDDHALTPVDLQRRLDARERVTLLDTRNREEVDAWRIGGSTVERVEVPYVKFVSAQVTGGVTDLVPDVDGPLVAVCPRGEASDEVAGMLREAGIEAVNLAGGMEAYARVYEAVDLPRDATGGVTVLQYRRPSSGCLGYLLVSGDEAAVVDPLRAFADRYAADAADHGAELRYALDTHVHADHVSGLRDVCEATGVMPVMSERAVERGVAYEVETVADGDTLAVGDSEIAVIETPGHTTGMVSLRVGDTLLTGDTLFTRGVPRPDLQEGDDGAAEYARELHRTLTERLARFDDEVLVAPGHHTPGDGPAADGSHTARIGDLREALAVFSEDRETFVERVLSDMPPRPANFAEIIEANLGRAELDDDRAFEVELGPNNCAAAAD